MISASRIAGVFAAICIVGCGGGSEQPTAAPQLRAQLGDDSATSVAIDYQSIDADSYSGITAEQTVVVHDASAWAALWQEHKKNYLPVPALPAIDFSRQVILGVFMGGRSSGCYGVAIQRVYANSKDVFVEYKEHTPAANDICTMSLTAPAQLVAIPRTSLHVTFLKVQ